MKRECDSPDLQEQSGLGKDCRSTRRKFHRLELNNGKGWLTCFGRVLYKGSKSYSITLDIRPGASMLVSTIMVFDGFNLEAGDHVEVSYTLETSAVSVDNLHGSKLNIVYNFPLSFSER